MELDRATARSLHALGFFLTIVGIVAIVFHYSISQMYSSWSDDADVTSAEAATFYWLAGLTMAVSTAALVFAIIRRSVVIGIIHALLTFGLLGIVLTLDIPSAA